MLYIQHHTWENVATRCVLNLNHNGNKSPAWRVLGKTKAEETLLLKTLRRRELLITRISNQHYKWIGLNCGSLQKLSPSMQSHNVLTLAIVFRDRVSPGKQGCVLQALIQAQTRHWLSHIHCWLERFVYAFQLHIVKHWAVGFGERQLLSQILFIATLSAAQHNIYISFIHFSIKKGTLFMQDSVWKVWFHFPDLWSTMPPSPSASSDG